MKAKTVITPKRLSMRKRYWHPLRTRLLHFLSEKKGNARYLAKSLPIADSQLHRFTCPICEHDQEPAYSTACAISDWLHHYYRYDIRSIGSPRTRYFQTTNRN